MSSRIFSASENLDWKRAYTAAVLEKDRSRLFGLIQKVIERLSERLSELRALGSVSWEEVGAISDAMYLLDSFLTGVSEQDDTYE
jgi:hypothetical protein